MLSDPRVIQRYRTYGTKSLDALFPAGELLLIHHLFYGLLALGRIRLCLLRVSKLFAALLNLFWVLKHDETCGWEKHDLLTSPAAAAAPRLRFGVGFNTDDGSTSGIPNRSARIFRFASSESSESAEGSATVDGAETAAGGSGSAAGCSVTGSFEAGLDTGLATGALASGLVTGSECSEPWSAW